MIKGITQEEYSIIKNIIKDYPEIVFYAYGSRVRGDFSALSDLDIMVKSKNENNIIADLKEKFDKSHLPYVVNFTNFNTIDENFYKLIKNDLTQL